MSSSEYGLCINQAKVTDLVMVFIQTCESMSAHDKRKSLYYKTFFVEAISGNGQDEI